MDRFMNKVSKSRVMGWLPRRKDLIAYTFLIPFLLFFVVFRLYPLFSGVYVSLTDYNVLRPEANFIGLGNYRELLGDVRFHRTLLNTVQYTLMVVPGQVILGLFLALYVNKRFPGSLFSRVTIFAPYVLSVSVTSFIWLWILETKNGLLNLALAWLGLPGNTPWLTSSDWAMIAVAITSLWWNAGFSMVVFLAGLQDIPSHLREAALVDGANNRQVFFHVTLPLLRPVVLLVITLGMIQSMQVFGQMYIMTQGGPAGATESVVYQILLEFREYRMGYSAAVGFALMFIILLLTILRQQLVREV